MQEFFIVAPLGLEKEVQRELILKWKHYELGDLPDYELISGGISLHCELSCGLKLNYLLRSANRILLRLKRQKCRDLPKLFNIMRKIPWHNYLVQTTASFEISASNSRLFHSKKIEKTCLEALEKFFQGTKLKEKLANTYQKATPAKIFLRFDNDELTISLDTSGELLYKRDAISFKGLAPLRNNLAYIMLDQLCRAANDPGLTLVDPMCGSGTFIHEALHFFSLSKREFYFERLHGKLKLEDRPQRLFWGYEALDIDKNIITRAQLPTSIKRCEDLFKGKSELKDTLVICNPPYGKKVKIDGTAEDFYLKLINRIQDKYTPKLIGIVAPANLKLPIKAQSSLKVFNGGIWVCFYIIAK